MTCYNFIIVQRNFLLNEVRLFRLYTFIYFLIFFSIIFIKNKNFRTENLSDVFCSTNFPSEMCVCPKDSFAESFRVFLLMPRKILVIYSFFKPQPSEKTKNILFFIFV